MVLKSEIILQPVDADEDKFSRPVRGNRLHADRWDAKPINNLCEQNFLMYYVIERGKHVLVGGPYTLYLYLFHWSAFWGLRTLSLTYHSA